ncbi:hypothetical protein H4W31_006824 [Plantactinospora soyae]|uniref:DUF3291 domain-containing protein n=1 Tax=Plantactinospora soyae TaxID=1544732 RepID=A0A927MDN1_9ACTN|nr:hypothetical protein [Plantactinospora soyae]
MLRSAWAPGPSTGSDGPMLVSVTDFQADRLRDLPGIFRAGLRLRRAWPQLAGAVGMWLWAEPLERRCGSVSIWQDEEALRGFVAWPEHVRIMRRYRSRGQIRATSWLAARSDPAAIWAQARPYLSGKELWRTAQVGEACRPPDGHHGTSLRE